MELFPRSHKLALEGNSGSCQTSKMELFAKIVKNEKLFTICANTEFASKVKDVSFLNQLEYQR